MDLHPQGRETDILEGFHSHWSWQIWGMLVLGFHGESFGFDDWTQRSPSRRCVKDCGRLREAVKLNLRLLFDLIGGYGGNDERRLPSGHRLELAATSAGSWTEFVLSVLP